MNYTLHQLTVFLKVVELKSVSRAAEALYLTQPAVSIQIKKLQDQFELPLTEVLGKKLYITDFGNTLAEKCKKIVETAEEIKHTVDQYKGLITGKLKISVVSTGKYVIPFFLKSFMDQYPGIDISVDVSNRNTVVKDLQRNDTDFALVSVIPKGLKLDKIELMDNKLFLVGNYNEKAKIEKPKDLENVNLLYREEGSATRFAMESYLNENKIQVKNSMELASNEAIKQAVFADLGFSLMPIIGLHGALEHQKVKVFPLEDLPMVTKWNIVSLSDKKVSPAHQAYTNFLLEHKDELVKENFGWISAY